MNTVDVGPGVSVEALYGAWIEITPGASAPVVLIHAEANVDEVCVRLRLPLHEAIGYWTPDSREMRTLLPGGIHRYQTSLIHSVPLGVVYNRHGQVGGAWALDNIVRTTRVEAGLSEEEKVFIVTLRFAPSPTGTPHQLFLRGPGASLEDCAQELVTCLAGSVTAPPAPVSNFAREPVYSTWYAFNQDLDARSVLAEARIAASLGFGSVFLDDGWQTLAKGRGYDGCGDWIPDPAKIPDLSSLVEELRGLGLKSVIWIAPLLLGPDSDAYQRLSHLAPTERLGSTFVVDPRLPEARTHLTNLCLRVLRDYGVDGLKIDFIDDAMIYAGTPTKGDIQDVGEAVEAWMSELNRRMIEEGLSGTIEFRQPYVSPALAPFASIVRAVDCPGDAVTNRVSVLDARLAMTSGVVHSDMVMWSEDDGPDAASWQLVNILGSVPQLSMRLTTTSDAHQQRIAGMIGLWRHHREVLLDGRLVDSQPAERYPVARFEYDRRSVIVLYRPEVVRFNERMTQTTVVNGTTSDDIVIDLPSPALAAQVHDSSGDVVSEVGPLPTGLQRVPVPSLGWVTIHTP